MSLRVGVGTTSMVSRVMAAISSKKRQMTSSRLVRSALQSLCKMSGAMDEIHHGEGEVRREFICGRLVV